MTWDVCLWGSMPGERDDCWTGVDYLLEEDAREAFAYPKAVFSAHSMGTHGELWVSLSGPDTWEVRRLRRADPRAREAEERADRVEAATLAGMSFGVDAWNEGMGY